MIAQHGRDILGVDRTPIQAAGHIRGSWAPLLSADCCTVSLRPPVAVQAAGPEKQTPFIGGGNDSPGHGGPTASVADETRTRQTLGADQ